MLEKIFVTFMNFDSPNIFMFFGLRFLNFSCFLDLDGTTRRTYGAYTVCEWTYSGHTITKKEKGIHEVCQSSGLSCYGNIGAVCAKNGLKWF